MFSVAVPPYRGDVTLYPNGRFVIVGKFATAFQNIVVVTGVKMTL